MRILHTSDWHVGRTLHRADLMPAFELWCRHVVEVVRENEVDAVLVSGDVYDRGVPPTAAVGLVDRTLAELAGLATVVVTAGNHDSPQRLGFGAALMRENVHIRTDALSSGVPVEVRGSDGRLGALVYPIPYLDPDVERTRLAAAEAVDTAADDVNMIDPFHLQTYGETTVNYNRDIEIFPVLKRMLERILGRSPYASPTDMGVNMVGFAIVDNDAAIEASKQEIIRRYYQTILDVKAERVGNGAIKKIELLMNDLGISPKDRQVTILARQKEEETGDPALALELPNGEIVTGKTSDLFGPTAAVLINAIKKSADIAKEVKLIEPEVVKPIQGLKIDHLGSRNPRLHSNEILIALAITATENPDAARAMEELGNLKGSEAHSTIILTDEDKNVLRKLGINVTFDPYYQYDRLYRK